MFKKIEKQILKNSLKPMYRKEFSKIYFNPGSNTFKIQGIVNVFLFFLKLVYVSYLLFALKRCAIPHL